MKFVATLLFALVAASDVEVEGPKECFSKAESDKRFDELKEDAGVHGHDNHLSALVVTKGFKKYLESKGKHLTHKEVHAFLSQAEEDAGKDRLLDAAEFHELMNQVAHHVAPK